MIARFEGILESISSGSIVIDGEGSLTYEILVPAYTAARLGGKIGQHVKLHTLYYFESQNQGATMIPRLAGFLSPPEREFFELFTTCKGIGYRKALRAMTLDTAQIAHAVANRDIAMLQSLPEIGRRTAETIVATLHGKVDRFLAYTTGESTSRKSTDPANVGDGDQEQLDGGQPALENSQSSGAREAIEVMVQLGENRTQVIQWVDQVLAREEKFENIEALIARVYQIKSG